MFRPKYKFVNIKTNEVLTYGDDNTIHFGGYWGELQREGKAEWRDNSPSIEEQKAEKLANIKAKRDGLLNDVVWMVDRHKQQLDLVQNLLLPATTLTTRQYYQLLQYIQELRDVPNKEDLDLDNPVFPEKPPFIA